jgi:hypothetical protein
MVQYYGLVRHVRGSVIIQGTSNDTNAGFIATTLERQLDWDVAEDQAKLWRLLDDVVASGAYTYYEWQPSDG